MRTRFAGLADQARESFNRRFWNEATGYLFDVVDGEQGDDRGLPSESALRDFAAESGARPGALAGRCWIRLSRSC